MNRLTIRRLALSLFFPFFLLSSLALAREIVDATQHKVSVVDIPKRVITLAPSLSELAADLMPGDLSRLVGVSEYSDYPPALKRVTSIGPYHRFNVEKIVALKPDLVLAIMDGNSKDQVLRLRELGIPVVVVAAESFTQIQESMRLAGTALGAQALGEKMASQFEGGLEHFRVRAKGRKPLRVVLQLSDRPLIVAGKKSFLGAGLEVLGAENIYGDLPDHYPKPSLEDLIHRNPDVIVAVGMGESNHSNPMGQWQEFKNMKAVKNQRIHFLRGDSLLRPTLRLLEGLGALERLLYH